MTATSGRTADNARRTGIFVLGMHRSGTSAITRVLNLLGAELPRVIMPSAPDNDEGFWEPFHLVALHDRILAESGSRWDDWRMFDPAVLGEERLADFRRDIRDVIASEYGDAPLFVLKDPRLTRLMAVYDEILRDCAIDPCFVVTHRNPLAVVASLNRRSGMTPRFGGLIWLRHMLDAEATSRGRLRCFISYEEFLDDWRRAAQAMSSAFGLSWPRSIDDSAAEIERFLSRGLQHHAATPADLEADDQTIDWITRAYSAVLKLGQEGLDADALAALDLVKKEFDAATSIFGEAVFPEIADREARLTAARDKFASRAEALEAANIEINKERERQVGTLTHNVAEARRQVSALQHQRADLDRRVTDLSNEIRHLRNSRTWRYGLIVRKAVSIAVAPTFLASREIRVRRLHNVSPASLHDVGPNPIESVDQRFTFAWPLGCRLLSGRYRLTMETSGEAAKLDHAILLIDSGDGFDSSEPLRLPWQADGRDRAFLDFTLDRGAERLHFRLLDYPCEIITRRFWLRRLTWIGRIMRDKWGAEREGVSV